VIDGANGGTTFGVLNTHYMCVKCASQCLDRRVKTAIFSRRELLEPLPYNSFYKTNTWPKTLYWYLNVKHQVQKGNCVVNMKQFYCLKMLELLSYFGNLCSSCFFSVFVCSSDP